jgi:Thiol-disulfide isomerase and thioredoxins
MKRIILGCIAVVFLFLIVASVILIKKKHDFKKTIVDMPEFCILQSVDSVLFCSTQLEKNKPVVLMYFHPECEICHNEARQLQQKQERIENIQWILVSYAERDSLNQFASTYQLNAIPYLTMLMDLQFELHDFLQVKGVPSCYIYDGHHKLVKVLQGAVKLENIILLANQ